jgi:hypothetical protein
LAELANPAPSGILPRTTPTHQPPPNHHRFLDIRRHPIFLSIPPFTISIHPSSIVDIPPLPRGRLDCASLMSVSR